MGRLAIGNTATLEQAHREAEHILLMRQTKVGFAPKVGRNRIVYNSFAVL